MSTFSRGPAPRPFARLRAAVPLILLTTLAAPIAAVGMCGGTGWLPAALAQGPGGGYHDSREDKHIGAADALEGLRSAARAPLRWLRRSSRSFQGLMRLLAERSAVQAGEDVPPSRLRRLREPVEVADDPPWRSIYGGEAGAGTDQGGARLNE